MKFCCIIPDRDDRKELTDFCFKQLDRMTLKPDKVYHINHRPQTEEFDLVHRITQGVNLAKEDGFDWVFIFENDDSYPADYFKRFQPFMNDYDFIGEDSTTYYNLKNLTHKTFIHEHRSSFFTTAFRISALNNYKWPSGKTIFLDIDMWKYARFKRRMFIKTGAIGMKHSLGLCGGKGHQMNMPNSDPNFEWLAARVDKMSLEFYKGIAGQLNKKAA